MIPILIPTNSDYTAGMISDARMSLQFDVEEPIELVDLTLSLGSFGNQYQRFVEWKTRNGKNTDDEMADYKMVLMHMPQMHQRKTKKDGKTSPDLGIIESIFPKELPVFWLSDMDAQRVKGQTESPFKLNYVVDVNVQTVAGAPRAYRILKLRDILPELEQ